jgi:hypothetical protein
MRLLSFSHMHKSSDVCTEMVEHMAPDDVWYMYICVYMYMNMYM